MLEGVDLFGRRVEFKFNGRAKAKSFVGAIASLLLFGLIIWSIFYVGQEMIIKTQPRIILSSHLTQDPPELVISPDGFNFAFGLQSPDTRENYIDESVYQVEVILNQVVRQEDQNGAVEIIKRNTSLETERCTLDHFGEQSALFSSLNLTQLYCIKINQSNLNAITIQGATRSPIFEYLTLNFKQCQTNGSSVTCADQDEIDKALGGGLFTVYFPNVVVNLKDFKNPSQAYRDSYSTIIRNTYYKEVSMWLNHIDLESNNGWVFNGEEKSYFIGQDHTQEMIDIGRNKTEFLKFELKLSQVQQYYERTYLKIQNVLATVDGFLTIGVLVIIILVSPYSRIKFYENLINELFDVRDLQTTNKEINKIKQAMKKAEPKKAEPKSKKSRSQTFSTIIKKTFTMKKGVKSDINDTKNKEIISSPKTSEHIIKNNEISLHLESPEISQTHAGYLSPEEDQANISSFLEKSSRYHRINSPKPLIKKSIQDLNEGRNSIKSLSPLSPAFEPEKSSFVKLRKKKASVFQMHVLEDYDQKDQKEFQIIRENLMPSSAESENPKIITEGPAIIDIQDVKEKFDNQVSIITSPPLLVKEDSQSRRIKTFEGSGIRQKTYNKLQERSSLANEKGSRINISFWDYIRSYLWRSSSLNHKLLLLREGIKRIDERLDIFNVFRKLREVDKLKVLLLENEQLVLFDNLPKPHLKPKAVKHVFQGRKSFMRSHLREAKFISEKARNELIAMSYENVRKKTEKTLIDRKLVDIYDEILK